ncbi:hypothetical protein BC940DRAFT_320602 [Gongronella butleri]|nr:hypothetical protein BC940DRAFT_320602 [Gongronella butleri]
MYGIPRGIHESAVWKRLNPSHLYLSADHLPVSHLNKATAHYELKHNKEYGDHLVAAQALEPGTLILREEPMVNICYPEFDAFCHQCFQVLDASKPATRCRQASCTWRSLVYCSRRCESEAWFLLHRLVCAIEQSGNSSRGLGGLQLCQAYMSPSTLAVDLDRLPLCEREGNAEVRQQTAVSGMLFSSIFKFSPHDREKLELAVRHCTRVVLGNSFAIRQIVLAPPKKHAVTKYTETDTLGLVAYMNTSKINHSCVPNAFFRFVGSTIEVRVVKPIKQGEQIFISYGARADVTPTVERRKELKDQGIPCQCPACRMDPSVHSYDRIFQCQSCKDYNLLETDKVCPKCKNPIDWKKMLFWHKALKMYNTIYHDFALPKERCYDELREIYQASDPAKAAKCAMNCLRIAEYTFGKYSTEAATELLQVVGALTGAGRFKDAMNAIQQCRQLYVALGLNVTQPLDMKELDDAEGILVKMKLHGRTLT